MSRKILYCRCAFANVVPDAIKDEVLKQLCDSGASFETVTDLCEMSARKDSRLEKLLEGDEPVKIAACYPRAVKWLLHNAGIPTDISANGDSDESRVQVLNMREQAVGEIMDDLLEEN